MVSKRIISWSVWRREKALVERKLSWPWMVAALEAPMLNIIIKSIM